MNPIRVVVVVDDHPGVRDGLAGVLGAAADVEVVGQAGGGEEALVLLAGLEADVVLMDLRMPRDSGVEAIRALRVRGPAPRVLVLTTYDTDRDIRTAMAAGADGYLLKDVRGEELVAAVRELAAGRAVLSRPPWPR